ncbi:MAG TPA: L-threonylcarbamoyladenylate synthase [Solirubrobacterales bacterium]|nr:L-threonylcarbamoyladenylate synthase [Solirubrobacterales bacterium]
MSEVVSIERDGPGAARAALERCVSGGGVAIFPADGLYGLACDPLNGEAIARIHALKCRDDGRPSAVMYFSPLALRELLTGLGPRAGAVAARLLPGPVTLVVANPEHRYPLACRADPDRLGIRLIAGPLAGTDTPIFQTSANRSGEPAPSTFGAIDTEILAGVDVAIDGGELTGEPSTVIDLSEIDAGGDWSVLREGAVSAAELERELAAV